MDMDMEHTDLLEDILRRLPSRALAISRSVCKAWRATVDHHHLLQADLLPLSLDAVIYNIDQMDAPKLFARRSTTRYITSRLDYLDNRPGYAEVTGEITDYCNGLLLIVADKVVNPATRQWASLPPLPCACVRRETTCGRCYCNRYLVYDPTVSPHYEVFYIPRIPRYVPADVACSTEWPPSPYVMHVFSSATNCWSERSFRREGEAAGTMADMKSESKSDGGLYYSAHWQGSLYVPLRHEKHGGFVMRIKLWNDNYQVIELPKGGKGSLFRLGKSKKGVYCVQDIDGRCTFKIWLLSESHGAIDWVLNNEICFETAWRIYPCKNPDSGPWKRLENGPWISQSLDQKESLLEKDVNLEVANEYNKAVSKDDFEWDSDDENVVTTVDWPKKGSPGAPAHLFWCLGFHPYKEIALFHDDYRSATFAYYLNSSKVRYLGIMEHEYYDVDISFAYTPCWTMDLPGST
ncbi:hypothetical protein D1007_55788 [Hordeum vulgare]|uniref:F-box domain-containing protein n=1 Tax=Hordeum vulgare subsp. vulgare TaxID=112509 RepID=A0A8I6YB79_HORVV|nr:hypothetical protein D1007_55788 [Hordeum vulgare]